MIIQQIAAVAALNGSNLYQLRIRKIKGSLLLLFFFSIFSPLSFLMWIHPFYLYYFSVSGLLKSISCRAGLLVISLRVFFNLFYFCLRDSIFFLHFGRIISPHIEYKIYKLVILCCCIILTHYLALAKLLSLFRSFQIRSKNKAFPEPH